MKPQLKIATNGGKQENDEAEPVSPTGQYFNSKVLSICIIAVLETEVPVNESCVMPQLRDVFLPLNPRFSSVMASDKKDVKQWKRVEVNLQDHVVVPSFPDGLSVESYTDYFDEYLTKITGDQLPQDRPLWELHIFKYPTSKAANHIIFKLHHSLGDGYSLMGALLSCLQRADNPSLPITFPSTQTTKKIKNNNAMEFINWMPRIMSSIYKGACDFGWSFLKSTCKADDKTPIRSENKGLGFNQIKISTIELPLDQIKQIKTKLGSTVNDTVAGIIFLGVRRYMQETDIESSNSQSTALVLLNTRNVGGYMSVEEMEKTHSWGNQFAFLHIMMPELINDKNSNILDFIYKAHNQIMRLRNSPAVYLTAQCLELIRKCRGPEAVAELVHSTLNKSSMAITNMIGPVEQVTLADHQIKGMYFMVVGSPQSLVITIMSYAQTLRIGIGAEKGFIDSQRLNSCIKNAFNLVSEAATKTG
uniref:Diacylglycerol O-acyltransferase n=1 Tax=Chenopodium quinoa TaxID=63459 RepID=A0A803L773_CHEQI